MRTSILVLIVSLAACGTPDTEPAARQEALTCDVGIAGSLGNACVKGQTPLRRDPVEGDQFFNVNSDDFAIGVNLALVNGAYRATIPFNPKRRGTYQIYLGTPDMPFALTAQDGTVITPNCVSSIAASECQYLRKVRTYTLEQNQQLNIVIGPTTTYRYVRLYVQTQIKTPPTCGVNELAAEGIACFSADNNASTAVNAVSFSSGLAPVLTSNVVYGIRIPKWGTQYAGQVVFKVPDDGVYELYLGTPNIPLRVVDGTGPTLTECSRYLPSTECNLFRRGTPMIMRIDQSHVVEFGPSASDWVRVTLRRLAPIEEPVLVGDLQTYPSGNASSYVTVGDLDGDGAGDLVVSAPDDASGANQITFLRNDGSGHFTQASAIATSAPAESVIYDWSGDGRPDVAALAFDGQGPLSSAYLVNQGAFSFTYTRWGGRDFRPWLSSGDFDGDGVPELVAAWSDSTFMTDTGGVTLIKAPGFNIIDDDPAYGYSTGSAVAGDFDGDGKQDVVAASRGSASLKLYRGNGAGSISFTAESWFPGEAISQLAAFDLDGDGRSDVVALHLDGVASIWQGTPTGLSSPRMIVVPGGFPHGIAAGDFDRDGRLDLAFGTTKNGSAYVSVFVFAGSGYRLAKNLVAPGAGSNLRAADVNGDGFADLIAPMGSVTGVWLSQR
jgi:hypothetical protein